MEIQKFVNLLNDADNEFFKFATRKRYVINDQITQNILKETKMIQELNLKPNHQIKLL